MRRIFQQSAQKLHINKSIKFKRNFTSNPLLRQNNQLMLQ